MCMSIFFSLTKENDSNSASRWLWSTKPGATISLSLSEKAYGKTFGHAPRCGAEHVQLFERKRVRSQGWHAASIISWRLWTGPHIEAYLEIPYIPYVLYMFYICVFYICKYTESLCSAIYGHWLSHAGAAVPCWPRHSAAPRAGSLAAAPGACVLSCGTSAWLHARCNR